MNIILVDDEPLALQQLERYVSTMPFMKLVGKARDAYEAQQLLSTQEVDAMFLDINMPGMDGMSFLHSLPDPPLVIFTTAYSEYAVESYKVNAVDYLLKPFGTEDFVRAAYKLYDVFRRQCGKEENDTLFLKCDYRRVRIKISDILFIESMSEYLRIFLESSDKPLMTLLSMHKMEEILPQDHFMRIHRSYIIHLDKIQSVQRLMVHMGKGAAIPVGDQYKEIFQHYLDQYSLGR